MRSHTHHHEEESEGYDPDKNWLPNLLLGVLALLLVIGFVVWAFWTDQ